MDNITLHDDDDIEDNRTSNSQKKSAINPDRDVRRQVIKEFFDQHERRDIRRFPMAMAKYVQTMHSNYITGQIIMLKVVREDYLTYKLNDNTNSEITEDWISTADNKGLVAYVEFWKIEENKNNFILQETIKFERPHLRQIQIQEKVTYKGLYKT